jgi:hypothetical protein
MGKWQKTPMVKNSGQKLQGGLGTLGIDLLPWREMSSENDDLGGKKRKNDSSDHSRSRGKGFSQLQHLLSG